MGSCRISGVTTDPCTGGSRLDGPAFRAVGPESDGSNGRARASLLTVLARTLHWLPPPDANSASEPTKPLRTHIMSKRILALPLSLLTLCFLAACGADPEPIPDTGSDAGPDTTSDVDPDTTECDGPDPSLTCLDTGCGDEQVCVEDPDGCGPSSCFCSSGTWACTADCGPAYACVPADPSCPEAPPIGETCEDDGVACEWGTECCCGDCFASTFCECAGGEWACHATDACFIESCEGSPCETDSDCEGGGEETVCVDGVCAYPSTSGPWTSGPDIPLIGACDDGPDDGYELESLAIDVDTLVVTVSYSGGCEAHLFQACWDGSFMESFPVQAAVGLQHDGNDDACEAWITEELRIPLSSMRESYIEGYGTDAGEIIIGIAGGSISFTFDACTGEDLPACGPECEDGAFERCGEACDPDVDVDCGNNIGDAMACVDGAWACTVHPPLGPGCNLVCR